MNASRLSSNHVLSGRLNKNGHTFTYHGKGYTYHLHKTAKDIWAKLQIARRTMQAFLKAVGLQDTSPRTLQALHGLSVCEQGVGGWYEVFVLDERKLLAVLNFIKKLNRFMLGSNVVTPATTKHHYFIEARKFEHTPPRHVQDLRKQKPQLQAVRPIAYQSVLQQPPKHVAPVGRLQMLAATVNSRYGH